ncbi:MAG: insulinase family protein [Deltaproteobacteria bacterium]|nr:insulinase family protein [Deltaproteobacteria bacterium]
MKKYLLFFFLISSPHLLLAQDPAVKKLAAQKLQVWKSPAVDIVNLKNGMKLYLQEDHELPLLKAFAYIKGGENQEDAARLGEAALSLAVMRTGGTEKRSVQEVDKLLEDHGASIESGIAAEYSTFMLNCLAKDQSQMFNLFFEILQKPRFDAKALQLAKLKKIESLKRLKEDPEKIAFREFPKLIYGENNVWARSENLKSVESVQVADLKKIHQQFLHPENIILAIAGDFKKEELVQKIESLTQAWPKANQAIAAPAPLEKKFKAQNIIIPQKTAQSTLVIGHWGDKRFNPDKFALLLMNYLLGGDVFSSRLGEEIRSNRGLAYSVYSHFGLESDYGLFFASAQTRVEATAEVISVIKKEIEKFQRGEDLSEVRLQEAKESILNRMVNDWEPRFNFVKDRARLSFYGYPENYYDVFREKLAQVSLGDIKRVAAEYLKPDALTVLIVGDEEKLAKDLEKLGKFEKREWKE